jgi:hypothetical protein
MSDAGTGVPRCGRRRHTPIWIVLPVVVVMVLRVGMQMILIRIVVLILLDAVVWAGLMGMGTMDSAILALPQRVVDSGKLAALRVVLGLMRLRLQPLLLMHGRKRRRCDGRRRRVVVRPRRRSMRGHVRGCVRVVGRHIRVEGRGRAWIVRLMEVLVCVVGVVEGIVR